MIKDEKYDPWGKKVKESKSYLASRLKVIFIIVFKYLNSIYPHYGIYHIHIFILEKSKGRWAKIVV